MPSGQVHNAVTFTLAGLTLAGGILLQNADVLTVSAGMAAGLFLSPDLDLAAGSIALSNVRKAPQMAARILLLDGAPTVRKISVAVGWLASTAWRVIWWPYGVAIKHRSWISHAPVVSTALRVLYLILLTVPFWGCSLSYQLTAQGWRYAALAFGGLCIADGAHIAMDAAETRAKRLQRKYNKFTEVRYE